MIKRNVVRSGGGGFAGGEEGCAALGGELVIEEADASPPHSAHPSHHAHHPPPHKRAKHDNVRRPLLALQVYQRCPLQLSGLMVLFDLRGETAIDISPPYFYTHYTHNFVRHYYIVF